MAATNTRSAGLSNKKHPPPHHHPRPQRPAVLNKRTHSHKGSNKLGHPPPKDEEDCEDFMAASFLQFCATCERQIITPCSSLLYCSESCRKRDRKSSYSFDYPSPTSSFDADDQDTFTRRDIVPPRSPTAPSARSSYIFSESMEPRLAQIGGMPPPAREDSEAAHYLRQFQSMHNHGWSTDGMKPTFNSRPSWTRSSGSTITGSAIPSLSHTPTSTASISPYASGPLSYQRPLPPRHPHSSSYGARSIDLVTPCSHFPTTAPSSLSAYSLKCAPSATTSAGMAAGELRYEKRIPSTPSGPSSLGQLFKGRA